MGSGAAPRFGGATFGRAGRRVARGATAEGSNNRARFPGTFGILRFLVIVDSQNIYSRHGAGPKGGLRAGRSAALRR